DDARRSAKGRLGKGRGALAGLLLLAAALLLPGLGAAPFERAEIYFLDAARAMVESGDWLVPRYGGEPFFDKPALAYWLMAASMNVFGATAAAGRLVSALAALGVLGATVWLGGLLLGRRSALCGGLVLATTLAFVSFGRLAMSDMLMTLWTTLAAALGVIAFGAAPGALAMPALGAVLGLGFLTKGPVAVLLPGLGLVLLAVQARRAQRPWPTPRALLLAAAVFLPVALGWFGVVAHRLGSEPLRYFFLSENLERFAGATYDSEQPPWYYLTAYLALGLPWSPLLPLAVRRAWRGTAPPLRFLLGWAFLMAVPLSLSRGKIDYYLLPLLPPLGLAIGHLFACEPWRAWERHVARGLLVAAAAALLLIVLGRGPTLPREWLPAAPVLALAAGVAAGGAALCLWGAARWRPVRTLGVLAGVTAALIFGLATFFVPAFAAGQPQQALLGEVREELRYRPEAALVLCGDPARVQRAVLFEARRGSQERCDLWAAATDDAPALFLLDADEQQSVGRTLRGISAHRYLPADTLTLRGLLAPPRPAWLYLGANFATESPVALRKEGREYRKAVLARRAARQARERRAAREGEPR
ncbi:MAG TPA: glycosyltransferase family 39 protein, partial [Vicinamibacteria bacterium]|nr:glycosyltransferase family 39 protein [Vicinamibacteria bacterium]